MFQNLQDQDQPSANRTGNNTQSDIGNLTQEKPTESNAIQVPQISLPKGGGALKGIDEKFEVNAANGTAAFSIPLPTTSGRNGFGPALSLSYNSGGGNSPFGLGWSVDLPSIQRKTDKRLPRYWEGPEEDVFMFSGAEDLVPFLQEDSPGQWAPLVKRSREYEIKRYRPRIEGGFARIEKITHVTKGVYWKVTTRDNVATFFGRGQTTESDKDISGRIADPENETRIFQWFPEFTYDDKGNWITYEYKAEDLDIIPDDLHERNRKNKIAKFTNKYLKRIKYGNRKAYYADPNLPYDPPDPLDKEYFFELVFDYGEHRSEERLKADETPTYAEQRVWPCRQDPFSTYRSGFEIRTYRKCLGVLMFHHFGDEKQILVYKANGDPIETPFGENYLVRSLDLEYEASSINNYGQAEITYLKSITQTGYIRKNDVYFKRSLPPMEFEYQCLNWTEDTKIKVVSKENIIHAPVGLTNNYQWADLYGEGISGILTEQGEGWYYKRNLGDVDEDGEVQFTTAKKVIPKPSYAGLSTGVLSLQDLEANGQKQVVVQSSGARGYFELAVDEDWKPFRHFKDVVNIDLRDPNVRLFDLNGDGQPELVVSEDHAFTWYAGNGKKGYKAAESVAKMIDEERGPAIVFADREQSIFLADMSGDGLTDIVRIRNREICYWANMGYGKFSAKINMSDAPKFDYPDAFNPQYLHLADVSGTGATDILYLGENKFKAYINLSGNGWSKAQEIEPFFPIDSNSQLSVIDLLGTGTSCIVWSSDLPKYADAPMRYIDLMDSKKPHILIHYKNNFGKETSIEYKSSTHFYLKDKLAGRPWITRLPFPVQLVRKLTVEEKITQVRFTNEYRYHHGYYDHAEQEFRGFGMVEQVDTEEYEVYKENNPGNQDNSPELYQDPVLTKTWYHTGAFLDRERILNQFQEEYWYEEYNRQFPSATLSVSEPELPEALLLAATGILDPSIINELSADEWREALRACKGMVLRQEVFGLDGPKEAPPGTDIELTKKYRKQFKPYTVATHNCNIQLLQPRVNNPYSVFLITESEALSIQYERDEANPRKAHTLNVKIDELGNVLESASVVYGRDPNQVATDFEKLSGNRTDFSEDVLQDQETEKVKLAKDQLKNAFDANLDAAKTAQTRTQIIYAQNSLADFDDDGTPRKDIDLPVAYRLRLPKETKTFELNDLSKGGDLYQLDDFNSVFDDSKVKPIPHQLDLNTDTDPFPNDPKKRLLEHIRSLYFKDNLTGALPFGKFESKALPYENYQLAYTPDLLRHIFGEKISDQSAAMAKGRFVDLSKEAGFVYLNEDTTWWIRSGLIELDPTFFMPISFTDPYGSKTNVSYYSDYHFWQESTEDALQNKVKVEQFNFRILAPQRMRDPNDNLSEVLIDELGLVKAVAVWGTEMEQGNLVSVGDNLAGLEAITSAAETDKIQTFFASDNSNELQTKGKELLENATSRFVYDFDRYRQSVQQGIQPIPVAVATVIREEHFHQNQNANIQLSFEYSDGLGNIAVIKVQAEPGEVKVGDNQIIDTSQGFPDSPRLRWIGNGRTVLNNKGNPVKQYEPYFSVTPQFHRQEFLAEIGVTPIMYYDPLGRLIQTNFPDMTFSKVEFDAWKQLIYDQNDTVVESEWYLKRTDNTRTDYIDDTKEQEAAAKAEAHSDTPSSVYLDALGRPVLSIAHNGKDDSEPAKDKLYTTFIQLDIEGNARSITDARGNTVMAYQYDLLGHRIYENSMDAGERWILNNVMGNPVNRWDSRNHAFSFEYDKLQRPIKMKVEGGDRKDDNGQLLPLDHVYEEIIYGEGATGAKKWNLRGQIFEHPDTAGRTTFDAYDFKGNLKKSRKKLLQKYEDIPNWNSNPAPVLEDEIFQLETAFDALNRPIRETVKHWDSTNSNAENTAQLNTTAYVYNEAGLLETVKAVVNGKPEKEFVKGIDYNEKGQRLQIEYGNKVVTRYFYEEETFRLIRLVAAPPGNNLPDNVNEVVGNLLQDLKYIYDPVGNITSIRNDAEDTHFFNNQKVEPSNEYEYDPLYRLTFATGRDLVGLNTEHFQTTDSQFDSPRTNLPHKGDSKAMQIYRRHYEYDPVGNMVKQTHRSGLGNFDIRWTKTFNYNDGNNQLLSYQKGNGASGSQAFTFDPHGNMETLNATYSLNWNCFDQLQNVNLPGRDTAFYTYDTGGQRVRKVIYNGHGIVKERIYLGGFELYRESSGLERESLHISDDQQRIALVETKTASPRGDDSALELTRYQLNNHLGTACLELDESATPISYEEYYPYGSTSYQAVNATIKAAAKRYRYTGKERDEETGLYYYGARYYAGWLGRWCSADPAGLNSGINLFEFVKSNPINNYDPDGKKPKGAWEKFKAFLLDPEYFNEVRRNAGIKLGQELLEERLATKETEFTPIESNPIDALPGVAESARGVVLPAKIIAWSAPVILTGGLALEAGVGIQTFTSAGATLKGIGLKASIRGAMALEAEIGYAVSALEMGIGTKGTAITLGLLEAYATAQGLSQGLPMEVVNPQSLLTQGARKFGPAASIPENPGAFLERGIFDMTEQATYIVRAGPKGRYGNFLFSSLDEAKAYASQLAKTGAAAIREASALPRVWQGGAQGNPVDMVNVFKIPPKTPYVAGTVGSQLEGGTVFGSPKIYQGGGPQVVIDWNVKLSQVASYPIGP